MDEKTASVLRGVFREHYFKNSRSVQIPDRIEEREFGYMLFGGPMVRHLSFKDAGELEAVLVREGPSGVYASSGYYLHPDKEMHEKGWKGADLVFDIDADQLPTSCKAEHDRWTCKECHRQGRGLRPEKCRCGSTRIMQLNWVCGECLAKAKNETLRLTDFLIEDLGASKNEMSTHFSGNMGYHVSIESSIFESLDQTARNEIADYLSGRGFRPESIGIYKRSSLRDMYPRMPNEREPGWRGRIASHIKDMLVEDFPERSASDVRDKIAFIYGSMTYPRFERHLKNLVKEVGVTIDPAVTTDIHRIFRMSGTLHGKTGMMKMRCDDLESFDPLTDPVVLDGEPMEVTVNMSQNFSLRGQSFSPPKDEKVSLPKMAAVYLLGSGLAKSE